jgi:hypothetical protein
MASTDTDDRVVVYLGNRKAIEVVEDPDDLNAAAEGRAPNRIRRALPRGKRCTTISLAPGLPLLDAVTDITQAHRGVWQAHSDADTPAWVASTDPALAQFLAAHWKCELRDPEPDHANSGDTADEPTEG